MPVDGLAKFVRFRVLDDVADDVFCLAILLFGEGREGGEAKGRFVDMSHLLLFN